MKLLLFLWEYTATFYASAKAYDGVSDETAEQLAGAYQFKINAGASIAYANAYAKSRVYDRRSEKEAKEFAAHYHAQYKMSKCTIFA
ncbi:hypothetical protein AB751O23_BA_00090, partial [Chlamydiales bacterium SCGC AB-751-O23]